MKTLATTLLCIITFLTCAYQAHATHALGADLSYVCIGPNQYEFKYTLYRDCIGIPAPSTINLQAYSQSAGYIVSITLSPSATSCLSNSGYGHGDELPLTCAPTLCSNGSLPGVEVYNYCGTLTLPQQRSDWKVSLTHCCRNAAITNLQSPDAYNQHIYTLINNENGIQNSSPIFTNYPTAFFCAGNPVSIDQGTVEPDGDSLVFSLINPLTEDNLSIPYLPGFSPSYPLVTTTPFTLDPNTGRIEFTPTAGQSAVLDVLVQEYRNGVLIGEVIRDMQYIVTTCSNQMPDVVGNTVNNLNGGTLSNGTITVCANQSLSFDFTAADPDLDSVTVELLPFAGNAPIVTSGSGSTVMVSVQWTPDNSQAGRNMIYIRLKDDACPLNASNLISIPVIVLGQFDAGSGGVVCNTSGSVQLFASGASSYTWTPTTGLSDPNIANPVANPSVTTTYYVTGGGNICGSAYDSVTITVNSNSVNPVVTADDSIVCERGSTFIRTSNSYSSYQWSPVGGTYITHYARVFPVGTTTYHLTVTDATGCRGYDSVSVTAKSVNVALTVIDEDCQGNGGSVYATASGGVAPYTYVWGSGDTTDSISGLAANVTHRLTVTDAIGCDRFVPITIKPYWDSVSLYATDSFLCPGEQTQLVSLPTAEILGCGTDTATCHGNSREAIVDAFGMYSGSDEGNIYTYPNGQTSGRVQYLIRADELNNRNIFGGELSDLGIYLNDPYSNPFGSVRFCNIQISMGCTSDTTLDGTWITGLHPVANHTLFNHWFTVGWGAIPFNLNDYTWDGTSNVVIEICYTVDGCTSGIPIGRDIRETYTTYKSVHMLRGFGSAFCNNPSGAPLLGNFRPFFQFNYCPYNTGAGYTASWYPPLTGNPLNPTVSPDTTTTYVVSITQNGTNCVQYDTITIQVADLAVSVDADTTVCSANAIHVGATVNNSQGGLLYIWSSATATFDDIHSTTPLVSFSQSSTIVLEVYDSLLMCPVYDTMQITLDTACVSQITGIVYHDMNGNCLTEPADTGLSNVLVELDGSVYTFTDASGEYTFNTYQGAHNVVHFVPQYFGLQCPNPNTIPVTVAAPGLVYSGNDFYDTIQPSATDVEVSLFCPPAEFNEVSQYEIVIYNRGSLPASPVVEFDFDSDLYYVTANIVPTTIYATNTLLTWNLPPIPAGQGVRISVYLQIPFTAPIGTALTNEVTANPITGDWTPLNNVQSCTDTVVTGVPFDPNDKQVSPRGYGPKGYITVDDKTLDYMIRFQNVGTAPAVNVVILDTLDTELDIPSFRAGTASHSYTLDIIDNHILKVTFANINLPDSATNEPASHGYITYSLDLKTGLPYRAEITNRAGIYFDQNPVIMTNTVTNTLVKKEDIISDTTSVQDVTYFGKQVKVYPNPANDVVHVSVPATIACNVVLMNNTGQVVSHAQTENGTTTLQTGSLPAGVYFLKVMDEFGNSTVKRVSLVR